MKEQVYPDIISVADKLSEKFSWTTSPSGDLALNLVGLSTQVPNKYTFISDGPYRNYQYRDKEIIFKKTSNRFITGLSRNLAILVQAIKEMGKDGIGEREITKMRDFYKKNIDGDILEERKNLPVWIKNTLGEIMED